MLRIALLSILLLLAPGTFACEVVESRWLGQRFPSVDAVLVEVAESFVAASQRFDTEFAGAIVEAENGYRLTYGAGCRGHDEIRFVVPPHSVALWHTHGARGPLTDTFSALDARVVRISGLPLFLVAGGRVQVLESDRLQRSRVRARGSLQWVTGYRGRAYPVAPLR